MTFALLHASYYYVYVSNHLLFCLLIAAVDVPRVKYTFNGTIWVKRMRDAKLQCPIINPTLPSLNVTWLVNGTVIDEAHIDFSLPSPDTLVINDVQFAHEGMYQCLVENDFGSVQTTFRLRTEG